MDENGNPGVGLQESPKYSIKGGIMGGTNSFGLLVILLFGFVTLLSPKAAMSACDGLGVQSYYIGSTGIKTPGTFCVAPDGVLPIVSATGYEFKYLITSLFSESLSQVNLTIPAAAKFCIISILSPTNRSVKIRQFEPTTGFSLTDTNTDVITWDALKLNPSNKVDINVFLTQAGAGPQVMQLKTATGPQYADVDGPICCSTTQVPTEIIFNPPSFGALPGSGPTFDIRYNSCTGEAIFPFLTGTGYTELTNGAFVCDGDLKGCNWIKIKKLGPRSGAALFTQNINTFSFASFFGFGNKIYKLDVDSFTGVEACNEIVPYEVVTFDNRIQVTFNSCGEAITVKSCTPGTDPLDCTTTTSSVDLYIAPGLPNGQPDKSQVFQILAGPRDGAIIYANPSYYCTVFGIGCYR